jgi:hypothetical protein
MSYNLGAQLGARLREALRMRRSESFINLLEQQHLLPPPADAESLFEGVAPVRIYRNWINRTQSYVIVFKHVAFLDLAPSLNDQEVSRICFLDKDTIREVREVTPNCWDKFHVTDATDFINIRYGCRDGQEFSLRLFAEVAGARGLTQDIASTVWFYHRLKDIVGMK